jgi:hypothetical protein
MAPLSVALKIFVAQRIQLVGKPWHFSVVSLFALISFLQSEALIPPGKSNFNF